MHKKFRVYCTALVLACLFLAMTAFAEGTAITAQDALVAALADLGVSASDVVTLSIEPETEHQKSVYDVEFTYGDYEYEYWINASDASIVRRSYEPTGARMLELLAAQQDADSTDTVNRNTARLAAIEDAGVDEGSVTYGIVKLDEDDGLQIYEVPFFTDDTEWEYDIDVVTGAIVAMRVEYFTADETVRPGDEIVVESDEDDGTLDSDAAKAVALEDAGLTEDEVTIVKLKQDYDDGIIVYEIEFVTETEEYDYEINVSTGEIYERKVKAIDGSGLLSTDGAITVEDAKSKAVVDAGYTLDQVKITKAEQDTEDGIKVYEIEFTVGGLEYEYTIRASDGTILESEVDND